MQPTSNAELLAENARLLERLEEAEDAIRAIRAGEVDALVVNGARGEEILTLQGADRSYRTIFETMNEGVAVVTREGLILYCNARLSTLLKQPMERVMGTSILPFIDLSDQGGFQKLLVQGARGISRGEIALRCADNSRVLAQLALNALELHGVQAVCVVAADITELKRTELALRRNEEVFHSAVNYFPGGFAIYDAQKRFQFVNIQASHLMGITQGEFIGHSDEELFPPDITSKYLPALDRCMEQKATQAIQVNLRLPSGEFFFIFTFVPILDEQGNILQVLGIAYDVTARRLAEQKVDAAFKKEVILRREIQHRVKNSIQMISSLLYLQSRELTDPKMTEILRECQARARSIALVYSMLSQREEIASIEFGEYAQQLIGALSSAYEVQREAVSFQIRTEKIFLDLDTAVPCGLILTELVSNALKHAFPNGAAGRISIDLRSGGDADLLLTVQDNGIGLPHGFDLETLPSLGLRLVRDLAEQIGGKIDFRSIEGTTIQIRFPMQNG